MLDRRLPGRNLNLRLGLGYWNFRPNSGYRLPRDDCFLGDDRFLDANRRLSSNRLLDVHRNILDRNVLMLDRHLHGRNRNFRLHRMVYCKRLLQNHLRFPTENLRGRFEFGRRSFRHLRLRRLAFHRRLKPADRIR